MEDERIVELYWQRSEQAVVETAAKYGPYCYAIANSILADAGDAEESVNDTYLGAWNSIPPHRPGVLSVYLGKLTRRISLNRRKARLTDKRGGGEVPLALEELSGCIPSGETVTGHLEQEELKDSIHRFLLSLPAEQRRVFICRYWALQPVETISRRFGYSQSKVKTMLHRTRRKLKQHLEQEGVCDDI